SVTAPQSSAVHSPPACPGGWTTPAFGSARPAAVSPPPRPDTRRSRIHCRPWQYLLSPGLLRTSREFAFTCYTQGTTLRPPLSTLSGERECEISHPGQRRQV